MSSEFSYDTWRSRRVAFLDFEASGLSYDSYPISVGVCFLHSHSTFYRVIRPHTRWTHWDPAAESIHGLGRDWIEIHGQAADQVARELLEWLDGSEIFVDLSTMDGFWFERLVDTIYERRPELNSVPAVCEMLALLNCRHLGEVRRDVSLRHPRTHNALEDAQASRALVRELLKPAP
ncbi:3'-5' exonuclease [Endobacter medicaginis]